MPDNKIPTDKFIKMQDLYNFKVFNPSYKECLTGTEWGVFMYILWEKLLYIRNDPKYYNGNTIKLDREFNDTLLSNFTIGQSSYERLITKLCKGGILYRIKKDWYAVNPYCFAKGKNVQITKDMCIFRKSTLNLPEGSSVFLTSEKEKKTGKKTTSAPEPPAPETTSTKEQPLGNVESSTPTQTKPKRTIDRFF